MSAPKAPDGLGPRGRKLWRDLHAALPVNETGEALEFDERDLTILRLACAQADDIAALEREIKRAGVMAQGSKGQPRLSQLVAEVRQGRLALSRLLGQVSLDDDAAPRTMTSRRAKRAADARWADVARIDERRGHGSQEA